MLHAHYDQIFNEIGFFIAYICTNKNYLDKIGTQRIFQRKYNLFWHATFLFLTDFTKQSTYEFII